MATKARLMEALRNADAAGDSAAAKRFAEMIRGGEFDGGGSDVPLVQGMQGYEQQQAEFNRPRPEQPKTQSSFADITNEAMSAVNRGGVGVVDTLGWPIREPINAALRIADANYQIPTLRESLSNTVATVEGGQMADGLPKRIVRAAGELIPSSVAIGAAVREAAASVPQIAQTANNMIPAIARQLGATTATGDAVYGGLSGAGTEIGRESGGDRGALIGSVAAPMTPVLAAQAGGSALRKLFGPSSTESAKNILDDFASFGATPTAGMVTGKQGIQASENVSAAAMGGAPLRTASEKIAQNMQSKLSIIANRISAKEGAETAGLAVQKGITGQGGFIDNFRQNNAVLWNKSDSYLNPSAVVNVGNTTTTLDDMVRGGVWGFLDTPKVAQIKSIVDSGAVVDYKTLRDLRSSIGAKLGSNDLVSDIPRADLKRLYGAITTDIKAHAQATSPEAIKAFERANAYTRVGHDRIDDYLQRIANKVNPDQVFKDIAKGGEGVKQIMAVKKSIPAEDWEVVASNVVRRLGRSTSGNQTAVGDDALGDAFSVNKFVTDWDKLGPARKAIFSGSAKLDRYSNDLNKIARAASVVKESRSPAANASGSAQAASRYAAGSSLVGSAVTANPTPIMIAAGSVAFNNAGARLMSNPKFVSWLAGNASRPLSSSSIGQLVGLAKESSAQDSADIYELAKELESSIEVNQ